MSKDCSIAESEYWAQFYEIRNDQVIKNLYAALCHAMLQRKHKEYLEINKIIQDAIRISYPRLTKVAPVRSYNKDVYASTIDDFYLRHPTGIDNGKWRNKSCVQRTKRNRRNSGKNKRSFKKKLFTSNKRKV